jgi:type II secretory pathway component PulM
MNWHNLEQKQKNWLVVAIILLVFAVLFQFVIEPIWQQKKELNSRLKDAQDTYVYLYNAGEEIAKYDNKHKFLSKSQQKQEINKIFSSYKVVVDGLVSQEHQTLIIIKTIPFKTLLTILKQLKNKYGIIVTKADIKRIKSGLVEAKLTLTSK